MKTIVALCILFSLSCFAQQRGADQAHVGKLPAEVAAKTISLNPEYAVYGVPDAIAADKKLPLLIYLHGGGGTGLEIGKIQRQMRRVLTTMSQAKIEAVAVGPQATKSPIKVGAKGGWQVEDLDLLLAHLLKSLPVDPDRVYLTGNSMGGYGTFMWAGYRPQHFAAIAPMVGGLGPLGPKDVTKDLELWGKNLATLPMRAYWGGKDKVVPPDRGTMIGKAIKAAGGTQGEIIILESEGHGAGGKIYSSPDFFKWLLSHTRKTTP
jgi:predicted peptidase